MADKKVGPYIKRKYRYFEAFYYMTEENPPELESDIGFITVTFLGFDGTYYVYKAYSIFEIGSVKFNGSSVNKFKIEKIDIKNINSLTTFSDMFAFKELYGSTTGLKYINFLPGCGGSSCTTATHWFEGCNALETVDFSGLDTSGLTQMLWTFQGCKLDSFSFNSIDVSSLVDIKQCFYQAGIETVDMSSLDANVINSYDRVFDHSSVKYVKMPSNINTVKPSVNIGLMFRSCGSLICLDRLDTTNMSNTANLFDDCSNLTAPDSTDQTSLEGGASWTNSSSCP